MKLFSAAPASFFSAARSLQVSAIAGAATNNDSSRVNANFMRISHSLFRPFQHPETALRLERFRLAVS